MVGLIALLPQVVDAVTVPVIAAGGIADARGVAAALILGASAVEIGTGFLRSPEAKMHPAYADRLAQTDAHETMITRAFSGRPGRSVATAYVRAASNAPSPAPYPVQRGPPPRCGNPRNRLEMPIGCNCGLGRPPGWRGLNRQASLFNSSGRKPPDCCRKSARSLKTRPVTWVIGSADSSQRQNLQ